MVVQVSLDGRNLLAGERSGLASLCAKQLQEVLRVFLEEVAKFGHGLLALLDWLLLPLLEGLLRSTDCIIYVLLGSDWDCRVVVLVDCDANAEWTTSDKSNGMSRY